MNNLLNVISDDYMDEFKNETQLDYCDFKRIIEKECDKMNTQGATVDDMLDKIYDIFENSIKFPLAPTGREVARVMYEMVRLMLTYHKTHIMRPTIECYDKFIKEKTIVNDALLGLLIVMAKTKQAKVNKDQSTEETHDE